MRSRSICSNVKRDPSTLCVVEDVRDLLALEAMGEYRGLYHILGVSSAPWMESVRQI